MCYSVRMDFSVKELTEGYNAKFENPLLFQESAFISGFTFPSLPLLTNTNNAKFEFFEWGLIPFWSSNEDIRSNTLNAKLETIEEKASFKNILSNRCILPVNGFYEWKWLDGKGKNKEKFLISSRNERIFSLAGLFDTWFDKDKNIDRKTFTLLTTEANPLMAEIHNSKKRMPLILQPGTEIEWLHQGNYVPENDLNPVSQDPPAQLNLF